jgi:hypothetical protein
VPHGRGEARLAARAGPMMVVNFQQVLHWLLACVTTHNTHPKWCS